MSRPIIASSLMFFVLQAPVWRTRDNEFTNRFEGLIRIPRAGTPDLTVIRFTTDKIDYPSDKSRNLNVLFYLPESAEAFVQAYELEERKQYRMQSKPLTDKKVSAWNTFADWPTGAVLL